MPKLCALFVLLFVIAAPNTLAKAAAEEAEAKEEVKAEAKQDQFDEKHATAHARETVARRFLAYLGEMRSTDGFNLSVDQHERIDALEDQFKADTKAYKREKHEELTAIQKRFEEARKNRDHEGTQQAMADLRTLLRAGPKPEARNAKIMELLTEDQRKAMTGKLDEAVAAHVKQMKEAHEERKSKEKPKQPGLS